MREACLPRKRRERERVIYSLRARLENVYPRGCRGVNAITFREMDLIALIIFNGRWEWKEKVHVENVERSTGIIEEGGGRRDFARIGINCTASASIVYRIATEPLLNRSVIRDRSLPTFSIMSPRGKNARIKFHLACGGCTEGWITNIYIYICIREIECRAYYGATRFLSVIDSGRNWVELGRDLFLALDSERLCVPFAWRVYTIRSF